VNHDHAPRHASHQATRSSEHRAPYPNHDPNRTARRQHERRSTHNKSPSGAARAQRGGARKELEKVKGGKGRPSHFARPGAGLGQPSLLLSRHDTLAYLPFRRSLPRWHLRAGPADCPPRAVSPKSVETTPRHGCRCSVSSCFVHSGGPCPPYFIGKRTDQPRANPLKAASGQRGSKLGRLYGEVFRLERTCCTVRAVRGRC